MEQIEGGLPAPAPPAAEGATARVTVTAEPLNAEVSPAALAEAVTPIGAHYLRAHFPRPTIDTQAHRIAVDGAVAQPLALTAADLRELETRTVMTTMECAGNGRLGMRPLPPGEPWALGAVSTAVFSGAPLAAILERARLRDDVMAILVEGADAGLPEGAVTPIHFARALPLDKALDRDVLLAWEMNGRPLPLEHGAPVRLIVPGWYGMASVKWVARVSALSEPFTGWFQTERYVYARLGAAVPVTTMRVRSLIVVPTVNARMPQGKVLVWGWAWSGEAPITRVDVALDGRWRGAALESAATPHAWARFAIELEVSGRGRHTVRARAADSAGHVQPDVADWNAFGYGNNSVVTVPIAIV